MLLYQDGYEVGRYVSLEKLIEETRDTYYAALEASSAGWQEAGTTCCRGRVLTGRAAGRLSRTRRKGDSGQRRSRCKGEMVVDCIERLPEEFAVGDIEARVPAR